MSKHDVIILGTSPNALACAARLAGAKLSVLVLDTREVAGGPVATEAFAPGFFADTGVMSAPLDAEIARDLDVGTETLRRGSVTWLGAGPVTLRELPAFPPAMLHAVEVLREINLMDPPSMPAPVAAELPSLAALSARLRGLGSREMHEVLRLTFMAARDYFEETVNDPAARALLCGAAVRGISEGPFAPGTLFNYLCHAAAGDALMRPTVRGGAGALSQALLEKAREAGAEVRLGAPGPLKVEVALGAAQAVVLGNGERIAAGAVVSDHDARATLTKLVSSRELSPEVNRAVRHLRYRGSVARVNLALDGPPEFPGVEGDALGGTLVVARDVASIERAWDDAKRGAMSRRPYLEVAIPTLGDPALAPEGKHVVSVWAQYVPYGLGEREALLKLVVEQLAVFAPGLEKQVLHAQVLLPEDLEARFGLTEGHLYGGENSHAQSFFLRPLPGFAHYGSPIENLYLGGSAAHPAGYTGRSGWNLARALLAGRGSA